MKRRAYLNLCFSILTQAISVISGLIVPRLILGTFGSEVNGLVSSLTQFLNYISLIEGGLGSVVIAALYSPLANHDNTKLNGVLKAASKFFRQIAYIFLIYAFALGIIYPFIVKSSFTFIYILSLTAILGVGLFVQYCFSITYKLLLQADQRLYVVQLVQIGTTLTNLILIYFMIKIYPDIHLIKLISAAAFLIQPLVFYKYVEKHYNIDKSIPPDQDALSQRWACFGQNLAYFIHNNTDVVVLSLFSDLKTVSVYSVYFLVVNSVKNFMLSISNAFTPIIGRLMAKEELEKANEYFRLYEIVMGTFTTIIFGTCIYMLPSFVMLYTKGINDAEYWQPIFSILIVLAEFVYCYRDPYISIIYSTGRFKETAISAYIEAGINITVSILLVTRVGLIGIAIGTFSAMIYRMIYSMWFVSNNILNRTIIEYLKRITISAATIIISIFLLRLLDKTGSKSILLWIKNGLLCVVTFFVVSIILNTVIDRKNVTHLIGVLKRRSVK